MRFLVLLGLFVFANEITHAQTEIYGKVIDSTGYELEGTSIIEIGTSNGTIADINGNFRLQVSDSSLIQFSSLGYKDTIIAAPKLHGDTIILRMNIMSENIILGCVGYLRTFSIGYCGGISDMPYGITSHFFRPYLFRKTVLLSGQLSYKTDFKKDHDFKFLLDRSDVIKKKHYNLQIWSQFQDRSIKADSTQNKIRDYQVTCSNGIGNIVGVAPGIIFRSEKKNADKIQVGYSLGLVRSFPKIQQSWELYYSIFTTHSEYSIAVYQKFFRRNWIAQRFQLGLNYNKYHQYDELNFLLRYTWSY